MSVHSEEDAGRQRPRSEKGVTMGEAVVMRETRNPGPAAAAAAREGKDVSRVLVVLVRVPAVRL